MSRPVTLAAVLAVAVFIAGCGASDGGEPALETSSGERVTVGGTEGLVWGDGGRGVVLAHGAAYDAASWEPQGQTLGENGVMALAVEDTSAGNILYAIDYLKEEYGVGSVALIGASAGAGPVLQVAEDNPEEVSQILLLSASGEVSRLGEYPKLFVASEDENIAEEVSRMAEEAPGDQNEALILSGGAHAQAIFSSEEGERLTQAIMERLEEYG